MGNIFSGSEIVELGIRIERNGQQYYDTLAQKSNNPKASSVFKFLSGEEEKHALVFKGMLSKLQNYEPQGLDADQYAEYMNSLASQCIFTRENQGEVAAKSINSDLQAIEMGIGFEKDSIIFYQGMKKVVPGYDLKVIDGVIAQEELHLKQLSELKSSI